MASAITRCAFPFCYVHVFGIILEVSKRVTVFFVAAGRLKSFHSIENYRIYIFTTLFCALFGVVFGYCDFIGFVS